MGTEIRILSTVTQAEFPDEWYDYTDANQFWFVWRFKALRQQLRNLSVATATPLRVLDVGCGHGILRNQIENVTSWDVDGADLSRVALGRNRSSSGQVMLYNIEDCIVEFKEVYDILIAFDVLEHLHAPGSFLRACSYHLKTGGWLFINVPALPALFGEYDRQVGHLRRYNKTMVRRQLSGCPFEIEDIRFWGLSMLPLVLLRKLIQRGGRKDQDIIQQGVRPPGEWFNRIMLGIMRAELAIMDPPPIGISLLAACRKR